MFGKSEFENSKSNQFNQQGAIEAINAIKRELGEKVESVPNTNQNFSALEHDTYVQSLVEKLPPHMVQSLGSLPEKLAIYNLSKGLSATHKSGLETILSCEESLCKKRLQLLDRALTKYFGSEWAKIKEQDFLEIEILLESWDFSAKVYQARDYVQKCKIQDEAQNEKR